MSVKSNSGSGQKFLGRNRAPRVQIEYDVELYGAEHRVQLPFVMGVLADLAGAQHGEPAGAGRAQVYGNRRGQLR